MKNLCTCFSPPFFSLYTYAIAKSVENSKTSAEGRRLGIRRRGTGLEFGGGAQAWISAEGHRLGIRRTGAGLEFGGGAQAWNF